MCEPARRLLRPHDGCSLPSVSTVPCSTRHLLQGGLPELPRTGAPVLVSSCYWWQACASVMRAVTFIALPAEQQRPIAHRIGELLTWITSEVQKMFSCLPLFQHSCQAPLPAYPASPRKQSQGKEDHTQAAAISECAYAVLNYAADDLESFQKVICSLCAQ